MTVELEHTEAAILTATSEGPATPGSPADPGSNPETGTPAQAVRNCTADHVIVNAGERCLHLSPLGETDVDEATIAAFALRDLSDQHVTRLSTAVGRAGSIESGAIFGIGFWAIIGYFIGLANIEPNPASPSSPSPRRSPRSSSG